MALSREEIARYYHIPISQATRKFNIGVSLLKRQCRKLGIKRWPSRKLISLQELINHFKAEHGDAQPQEYTREIITRLLKEKKKVEENPNYQLPKNIIQLRKRSFKARYKKRKSMGLKLAITNPREENEPTPLEIIYPTNEKDYEELDDSYDGDCDKQD
ncbi:RWP-RK domain-containing protein [Artemisia annua]|uniref:RWP-RK domain-containing protein n=1 Tax=Artemisia annua TaxID=35608 RepID=A0A2U1PWT6_ARTAN|nr:RWP-RK domain-containing protein [Artemisia annua]